MGFPFDRPYEKLQFRLSHYEPTAGNPFDLASYHIKLYLRSNFRSVASHKSKNNYFLYWYLFELRCH